MYKSSSYKSHNLVGFVYLFRQMVGESNFVICDYPIIFFCSGFAHVIVHDVAIVVYCGVANATALTLLRM